MAIAARLGCSRIRGIWPLIYVILCKNTGFALLTLPPQPSYLFLGKFANLRRATVSFIMSVRPSAWNSSAPTAAVRETVEKIHV
jgi:hypothetical protein